MTKWMKIRLVLLVVLGSWIAWQQYQRQSVTIISTQSVLQRTGAGTRQSEETRAGAESGAESGAEATGRSQTAELWSADALRTRDQAEEN